MHRAPAQIAKTAAFAACLALSGPSGAEAQENWISSLTPGDILYVGWAHTLPHGNLWFHCAGRPDGQPMSPYTTIAAPTFTHGLTVELRHPALTQAPTPATRSGVALDVDGTRYLLPEMRPGTVGQNQFWFVDLSMADPLFADIRDGGSISVVVDGTVVEQHTGNIAGALTEVTNFCLTQYAQAGVPLPAHAAAIAGAPQAAAPTPAALPAQIDAHIRNGCGAGYQYDASRMGQADLDRDGTPDAILDWADVVCEGSLARPYCGAANCSIDVFLSTRPGQQPAGFLGVGYRVVPARNGALGLQFGGTAGACDRGECDDVFWWDGAQFQRQD